jgi:hypothetical protein
VFFTAMVDTFRTLLGPDWGPQEEGAWHSVREEIAEIVQWAEAAFNGTDP